MTTKDLKIERLCLAYRYLYYVRNVSAISDEEYDRLESLLKGKSEKLSKPGSDNPNDYSTLTKLLADKLYNEL